MRLLKITQPTPPISHLISLAPSSLNQTEEDFAAIAGAGLNFVRIPIGFWAIETMGEEPFLVGTSWKYFLKAYASSKCVFSLC
jgi:hypothetical protein